MENPRKSLCIYHFACADGFGAAWAVRKALGDAVEFRGGRYGMPPLDVTGRDVIMVDFSYKRAVLEDMAQRAHSILILDHHKTAQDDLSGVPTAPADFGVWKAAAWDIDVPLSVDSRMAALFDIERSGAGLTWDFFHPGRPRPKLINHLEDWDLWRFRLPDTRKIQANVSSYRYDFDVWDQLMEQCEADAGYTIMVRQGEAIERKHHNDVAELVDASRREMIIGGIRVPVANLPYTFRDDAAELMAREHESMIGVCYFDTPDGRKFSLRSLGDGPDVSKIAERYNGGGHAHAAGFIKPLGWEGDDPVCQSAPERDPGLA